MQGYLFRLAGMELEEAMLFGKYHQESGIMILQVFADPFPDRIHVDKMNFREKFFEPILPGVEPKDGSFFAQLPSGIDIDHLEAGVEEIPKVF
jgi:hypothetical protein